MEEGRQKRREEMEVAVLMIEDIVRDHQQNCFAMLNMVNNMVSGKVANSNSNRDAHNRVSYSMTDKMSAQVRHMNRLTALTDVDCINNLWMDRNAFGRLCRILRDRCGLVDQRYVRLEEQVAMFLSTLAHQSSLWREVDLPLAPFSQLIKYMRNRSVIRIKGKGGLVI